MQPQILQSRELLKETLRRESEPKQAAEKKRLADQALEKSQRGIALSRAEKSALARTSFRRDGELIRGSELVRTIERQEKILSAERKQISLFKQEVPTTREGFLTSLFERQGARVRREGDVLLVEREATTQLDPKNLQFATTLLGEPELPPDIEVTPEQPFVVPRKFRTPGGLISTRREVPIITTLDQEGLQQVDLDEDQRKKLGAAKKEQELFKKSFEAKFGTDFQQAAATLELVAIPKVLKAAPFALGFLGLTAISPPVAGAVAFASIPSVTKSIQAEVAKEGLTKTIIAEAPTFAVFGLASKAGLAARGVAINKLQTFRSKLRLKERLSPAELLELQRLEKAVRDVSRVQPEVNTINLGEVERLSPKASRVIERIILDNKDNIIVGGSVASRTQLGISRTRIEQPKNLRDEVLFHFTTKSRVEGILKEGFLGKKTPIHILEGSPGQRISKDVVHVSPDKSFWKFVRNEQGKVISELTPVRTKLTKDANVLMINNRKEALNILKRGGSKKDFFDPLSTTDMGVIIRQARREGFDAINFLNKKKNAWDIIVEGEPRFDIREGLFVDRWSQFTGGSSNNEWVIINKKKLAILGTTQIKDMFIDSRIPKDVDLFTSREPGAVVRDIVKDLRKAGVKRVSGIRDKQITIEGKKAIEVKKSSLITDNIKKVQTPFEVFDSGLIETPRGVKVLKIGIQARRKLVGGFGLEGARRRAKDIPDIEDIARSLFKTKIERAKEAEILPEVKLGVAQRQQLRFLGIEPQRLRPRERPLRRKEEALFEEEEEISDILFGKPKDLKILDESIPSGRRVTPSRGGLLPSTDSVLEQLKPREIESILAPTKKPKDIFEFPSLKDPFEPIDVSSLFRVPKEKPSVLKPTEIFKPSPLIPTAKERPSVIKPVPPPEIPSILKTLEKDLPSITDPFAKEPPSISTPPISDVGSLMAPTEKQRAFPFIPVALRGEDILKPKTPGYDVFVREGERRRDKFIKAADNLPFNRALGRGVDLVDGFIEASFKIKKSGKKTSMIETFAPDLFKFRPPKGQTKLTQDVFVERRKHRLDSIGEVAQISFFKEQARKKKEGDLIELTKSMFGKQKKNKKSIMAF